MDGQFFTHDATTSITTITTTDSDDNESFSLDVARTVRIDNPPWVEAFDTDRFHEFEVVVARPMRQTYHVDGEEFVFEKLPAELEKAAWSLDNAPFPIGHPISGAVKTPDDVHGFLREPEYVEGYDEDGDALVERLYVPVDDQTAIDHITDHQDVSVGFFNQLDWDTEDDDVDAYQRDMLFDHVAGVTVGRCSGEDGCGIDLDDQVNTVLRVDETEDGGMRFREQCSDGPCSCGLHSDSDEPNADTISTDTMSEETSEEEESTEPEIDLDSVVESMSLDALAKRHDEVAELQSDLDEAQTEVESKEDRIDVLEDAKEDLEATITEFEDGERRPKHAIVDSILDMTDRWSEEELMETNRERLEDREEIVSDVAATPSAPSTDNEPSTDEEPSTDTEPSAGATTDDGYTISMDERSWGDD